MSAYQLVTLKVPPGLYKNGTEYQSKGRFYDADLVRWYEGAVRPVGGWRARSSSAVSGKARAVIAWQDNSNLTWIGIGTHTHLYAMSRSGTLSDITPAGLAAGRADAVAGGGYGLATYGTGIYGQPRPDTTSILPASTWALDTWGEYLVGCFDDTIFEWQLDTMTPAAAVANAPAAASVLVTEERIMMALGSDGDPRAVDWSDAEDNTDWTPSATNLAGGRRLQTSGRILLGKRIKGGNLIFTDVDVHRATYVNLPQVYQFERLATGCGAISANAVAAIDARAFWMGQNGFWVYDGDVSPLPCDVSDYLFKNLNRQQASKVGVVHNSAFGEVWWFYPSASSLECDRYVIFNYREGHWSEGRLSRLSGVDRGVFVYPILIGDDGLVYEHEVGQAREGRTPFAKSGPTEIGDGQRRMEVYSIIPDEEALGEVTVRFQVGDWTLDPNAVFGPYAAATRTDCRFSGRRVAAEFRAVPDQDFRIGDFRFEVKPGSPR